MASDQSVFQFGSSPLTDDDLTPAEDAFARELYQVGRDAQWLAPTKRFSALYDLGAHLCVDSDTTGTRGAGQAEGTDVSDADPPAAGLDETSVMAALVAFDASLPLSVRSRWRQVHAKYTELVQTPTLNYNKLRCRVRRLKAAMLRAAPDVTTVESQASITAQVPVDGPPHERRTPDQV